MDKKILFIATLLLTGVIFANAQITTGDPSATVVRTGNRPEAGDFGLFAGVNFLLFDNIPSIVQGNANFQFRVLPLVNLKYYMTDNLEARVGVEIFKHKENIKGDFLEGNNTSAVNTFYSKNLDSDSHILFFPGIAYHFARTNLLDVYGGFEIPFGWATERIYAENQQLERTTITSKASFQIGIGAFIGVQAFIANLPLAIGLEYGISSRYDTGLKYKHQVIAGDVETVYYTPDLNDFNSLDTVVDPNYVYQKLQAKTGAIGNEVRITLSYYFK